MLTQQEYDDALRDWQTRYQWNVGDQVIYRDTDGKIHQAIINAVDMLTRRLRIILSIGRVEWVYEESVYKSDAV
jgi:hypothetical protein